MKIYEKTYHLFSRNFVMIIFILTPALLSSNMIVAKVVVDIIPPFTLAFTRWVVAVLFLLPFVGVSLWKNREIIIKEKYHLFLLGLLGMGVCGAFPYIGAKTTTAINIGLIYTLAPIFVIFFAKVLYKKSLSNRQFFGVLFAFLGVLVIVAKGDYKAFENLEFTIGDLWILGAAAAWGLYSLWLGHLNSKLSLFVRFTAVSTGGVIALAPFAFAEVYQLLPLTLSTEFFNTFILTILFLAIISSISAYAAYAYIQKIFGASKSSLVMYAIPVYNAGMACVILDEQLQVFHLLGTLLILPGLYLAVSKSK